MPEDSSGFHSEIPRSWHTFLDTPPEENDPEKAQVVLLPVPYDATASYKTGTRNGPDAIISASCQLEDFDLELGYDLSVAGIHTAPAVVPDLSSPQAMVERVRKAVLSYSCRGKLVGLLGGEHTIAIGAVAALAEQFKDLSVLYLDAHSDLRDSYLSARWCHATVARRIVEKLPVVEVGIRSLCECEDSYIKESGVPVFYWPLRGSIEHLVEKVSRSLTQHIYLSIDLDVLDPSCMAAVGAPEPGGMSWNELMEIIRSVTRTHSLVGFDVCELRPHEGFEYCDYTAAKTVYKCIGYAKPVTR